MKPGEGLAQVLGKDKKLEVGKPIFPLDRFCILDYMINESYIHGGAYGR